MPYDFFLKMETVPGEKSAPSVGEIVVTKSLDSTSPLFFDEKDAVDSFAYHGDGAGGANFLFCDGSVRNATDDGLLLPAVKTDDGLLLPAVKDGTSLDDGGIIIDYFPTETVRPMESLDGALPTSDGRGEWDWEVNAVHNADADLINGWDWEAPTARDVNYGTGSFTVANVSDPADAHAPSDYFLI